MENYIKLFGIHLILIMLVIIGGMLITKTEKKTMIFHFIGLYLLTCASYFVPNISIFDKLTLMWQAKTINIVICTIYILLLYKSGNDDISFSLKFKSKIWIYILCFLIFTLSLNCLFSGVPNLHFDLEYFIFSLTLPGISEELFFRGIMMNIFNRVFTTRKQVLGISIGWAAVVQILLFGIGHSFYIDDQQHIQFYLAGFLFPTLIGIFLTFVKEKSGSILPAIILHNSYNTISCLF